MAFPFPLNPVDGQTVSHVAADGTLMQATFDAAKNTWNVKRSIKQPPVLLSARTAVTLPTATADGQVIMWDDTAKNWKASAIALATKDLSDVDGTVTPANGYVLVYDGPSKKYKPVPLSGGTVLTATTVGVNGRISAGAADVPAALTALYQLARPAAAPKGGDAYIITAVKGNAALDKYAGTYLYDGTTWLLAASSGQGSAVNYRASATTVQKPGEHIGEVDVLNVPNDRQINVFDGTSYQLILGETQIKQWIAAGSLFQGTLTSDADLNSLPAAGTANRGYYWTWTGTASHAVTSPLTATLQVGDWIQSDGTKYIHVPSDLMSKLRWESVGSFRTWADGSYEQATLVYHAGGFYRATSAVVTGDVAPDDPANTKWQKLSIQLKLEELTDVNDNVSAYGQDCVLVWDEANREWTASRTIEIDAIEFDESGAGTLMTGIARGAFTDVGTNQPDQWVPSVYAVKAEIDALNLEDLADTKQLATAADGEAVVWDATNNRWKAKAVAVNSLSDIGDVNITTIPSDGEALTWDVASSKWVPKLIKEGIPLFKGSFSVGSNTGTNYVPPNNPKEGDIWVDKNNNPPVFKVYRNGAWVLVNWQTDHLGLLSDLANVNVGASGSPGQGDALIFNQLTEQWESGAVPAHITEYDRSVNYSAGTTVYYKGGLFEAATRTTGVSPAFQYGDCWLYHRSAYNGSGDWVGPISFETVNIVADETVAPTVVHQPTDLRPHWTLQWKDDQHFSVWMWELSMVGWTPGSPPPAAKWHNYTARFTKPNAFRIWRNYSTPPQHIGDCVVWIYDDPKGTNQPHYRLFPWILRPIRSDLISMHDVKAENPGDQNILIWDTATSYWEAKPNPSYTKAETDTKIANLMAGMAHEESVLAMQATPPTNPQPEDLYIIYGAAAGAWAGHANELAEWDGQAWKFYQPKQNETHLNEATNQLWHWNGTAWVKVGEIGLRMVTLSQMDYDALPNKDAATLYLIRS